MSDLARRLIAENRRARATSLDLGNCGLTEIPEEIGELYWLQSLSLASAWSEYDGASWQRRRSQNSGARNAVTDLAPLVRLSSLSHLVLADTRVKELGALSGAVSLRALDISGTQVADLAPLTPLTSIETLVLSNTLVTDLAPLASLSSLQTLDLSSNRVTDLTPLASLPLQALDISRTQVFNLAPLSSLSSLQRLYLSNPVTDLRSLASLSSLQLLDLSNSRVTDLAPLASLTSLETLNLARTPVADLAPLALLTSLKTVDVSHSQVIDLACLGRLTSLQSLNLSHTQVADLAPLVSLNSLHSLDLSGSQVTCFAALGSLTSLQTLNLSHTQVDDVSSLAPLLSLRALAVFGTQVADLAPLVSLTSLQALYLHSTLIVDLAPLTSLTSLQILVLSNTQVADLRPLASLSSLETLSLFNTLVADLTPLASLTSLRALDVASSQVTDLAPLSALTALQTLNFSRTQVASFASLAELTSLQTLNLANTQVTDLSPMRAIIARGVRVKWSDHSWEGPGIYVEECPLINPPPEIVQQGNDAIHNYFNERDVAGVDYLHEAKVLILGEGGSGKTSLLRRLYQPERPLPNENETTRGIEIHRRDFPAKNGRTFRLNVWDFGGQEIYHATHQFFLTRRSLYVLLDDTRKDQKSVADPGFKYWLDVIDLFSDKSPVLIFQNEKDGRSKAIDLAGIKGRYDNVKDCYAGNLEDPRAADALRDAIEFHATTLGHIGEELPARWIQIRKEIEERAANEPHIGQQAYFEIYARHLEFDKTKALHLSRYLHDLGVFLHFQDDPLLARTVFLQNSWVTQAVYRILDDEILKRGRGRFGKDDTARLWSDAGYAEMHPELLALMQHFELCYVLSDTDPRVSLAPQLLPPARPAELVNWGKPDDRVLRYRYGFLPKGIVSRLTVRLHRYVRDPELAWTTGVLFEREGSQILVQILDTGAEIELRARGSDRRALLSVVAADLDALNDAFRGLRDKVDKLIPCNCKQCRNETVPEFFSEKSLRKRRDAGRLRVECPSSYEEVAVLELLEDVRTDEYRNRRTTDVERGADRTIRLFLASSSELQDDRDAFDLYVRQQNDRLRTHGVYLAVIRCESFLDAMSGTRLQDEYNRAIEQCDLFVSLFFTRTGRFTEEEFETTHRRFQATGKPRIYTFFKDADIKTGGMKPDDFNSRWAFERKLKTLGHFTTSYGSIEHLKRQFRDQLDLLLD